MTNSIIEQQMEIPAEHERNLFGQFDEHIKKIERTLRVTLISRDGMLKIIGPASNVKKGRRHFPGTSEAFSPGQCDSGSERGLRPVPGAGRPGGAPGADG